MDGRDTKDNKDVKDAKDAKDSKDSKDSRSVNPPIKSSIMQEIQTLIKSLMEGNSRGKTALTLSNYGEDTIKALIPLLAVDDEQTKWRVIFAISRFGDSAINHLLDALRRPELRDNAAKCLSVTVDPRIKKPHVVDILIKALEDEDECVRATAAELLGEIGDQRSVKPLVNALKDVPLVREKVAWALAFMGKRCVKDVVQVLKSTDWQTRQIAADILIKIGEDAVDALIDVLYDPLWFVRQSAAKALGEIGDKRAIPHLVELLNDEDVEVRKTAKKAIDVLKKSEALET